MWVLVIVIVFIPPVAPNCHGYHGQNQINKVVSGRADGVTQWEVTTDLHGHLHVTDSAPPLYPPPKHADVIVVIALTHLSWH